MGSIKFNWDASALIRETLEVEFPTGKVVFNELTKARCDAFIADSQASQVFEEVEETYTDEDGTTKSRKGYKALPIDKCAKQQTDLINKWLAETTAVFNDKTKTWEPTHDKEFFDDLCANGISQHAYGLLIEAVLFDLQHVTDILAVRGNYLRLPEVLELDRAEAAAATK